MQSRARRFTGSLRQFALWRDQTCRPTGGRVSAVDDQARAHLAQLRANASTLRWTLPSGRTVDSVPPPALGLGSDHHLDRSDGAAPPAGPAR